MACPSPGGREAEWLRWRRRHRASRKQGSAAFRLESLDPPVQFPEGLAKFGEHGAGAFDAEVTDLLRPARVLQPAPQGFRLLGDACGQVREAGFAQVSNGDLEVLQPLLTLRPFSIRPPDSGLAGPWRVRPPCAAGLEALQFVDPMLHLRRAFLLAGRPQFTQFGARPFQFPADVLPLVRRAGVPGAIAVVFVPRSGRLARGVGIGREGGGGQLRKARHEGERPGNEGKSHGGKRVEAARMPPFGVGSESGFLSGVRASAVDGRAQLRNGGIVGIGDPPTRRCTWRRGR